MRKNVCLVCCGMKKRHVKHAHPNLGVWITYQTCTACKGTGTKKLYPKENR